MTTFQEKAIKNKLNSKLIFNNYNYFVDRKGKKIIRGQREGKKRHRDINSMGALEGNTSLAPMVNVICNG